MSDPMTLILVGAGCFALGFLTALVLLAWLDDQEGTW